MSFLRSIPLRYATLRHLPIFLHCLLLKYEPHTTTHCLLNFQQQISRTPNDNFQDIKSVLGNFASNIIFSNGLRDPYSAGKY